MDKNDFSNLVEVIRTLRNWQAEAEVQALAESQGEAVPVAQLH